MCTHLSLFCFPNTSTCCHWCQPEFDKIWLGPSANIFYPYKDLDIKFPISIYFIVKIVKVLGSKMLPYYIHEAHSSIFCSFSQQRVFVYQSVLFFYLFYQTGTKQTQVEKKDNLENTSNNMQNLHPSHITNITIWKRQLLHLQSEASSDLL